MDLNRKGSKMQGNIFVKKHTVPFKMIPAGGCFLYEGAPSMKIMTSILTEQTKRVDLNTGIVYSVDEDDRVVPMHGKYELWEEEDRFNE